MSAAVPGAGGRKALVIETEFGLYFVGGRGSHATGPTLEVALAKAAPNAPAEYIHHAAEILQGILDTQEVRP